MAGPVMGKWAVRGWGDGGTRMGAVECAARGWGQLNGGARMGSRIHKVDGGGGQPGGGS